MAWEHLSIDKPHLVYIILGGFTALFMLCSSVIKERLYIGEATVATICGIIFGPHAANFIDPGTWGNTDKITLEFARIVLVVQCFAVGVELPKAYMERHWKSVVLLLVPVMTVGWLITSVFIWAMFSNHLSWLDSLTCAACVTATDPVLASSVVGKGKFAKRVPKHLRDLLSAESGCNDGMAFPFIYLALYIVRYQPDAGKVTLNWICITILYECIFGAVYGVIIGYCARRAIRYAHEKDLIDRESFLVFYFVLALFCAGSGSLLGMDDLLIGFACGVGFSNDGWFTEKTEETHVSNVIDLLINLAFFVYFGTIIPWAQFNQPGIGITAWRLVVVALLVLFFRRIPIMLALKPVIPDIKLWREALFAGHFGPIGVGALFVAILARAELETDTTTPLAVLPAPGTNAYLNIITLIWPITTFLVLTSIIVHGSSIAVFTLGKHINTLTITMSYTQGNEEMSWMERLPRIQSRSKSSTSLQKPGASQDSLPYPQAMLGLPRNFLRRQKEEDPESRVSTRPTSRRRWSDRGFGAGGPISQSAIAPQSRKEDLANPYDNDRSESATLALSAEAPSESKQQSPVTSNDSHEKQTEMSHNRYRGYAEKQELYQEGHHVLLENEECDVLKIAPIHSETELQQQRERAQRVVSDLGQEQREKNQISKNFQVNREADREKSVQTGDQAHSKTKAAQNSTGLEIGKGQGKAERPRMGMRQHMSSLTSRKFPFAGKGNESKKHEAEPEEKGRRRGPARAFRLGRTIIIEDEDGEVIEKYDIPAPDRPERKQSTSQSYIDSERHPRLQRVGTWLGMGAAEESSTAGASSDRRASEDRWRSKEGGVENNDDDRIRFTMDGSTRRMTKAEFIRQIQSLDPKMRSEMVQEVDMPERVENKARNEDGAQHQQKRELHQPFEDSGKANAESKQGTQEEGHLYSEADAEGSSQDSVAYRHEIPLHSVSADLQRVDRSGHETAAQRRRRLARTGPPPPEADSDDDGTKRVPPAQRRENLVKRLNIPIVPLARYASSAETDGSDDKARVEDQSDDEEGETAAERRRREAALGVSKEDSDSDEDTSRPREPRRNIKFSAASSTSASRNGAESPMHQGPMLSPSGTRSIGIRFADQPHLPGSQAGAVAPSTSSQRETLSWRARSANRRTN